MNKGIKYTEIQALIRSEIRNAKAAKDREQEARARRQLLANTVAQEIRQHVGREERRKQKESRLEQNRGYAA